MGKKKATHNGEEFEYELVEGEEETKGEVEAEAKEAAEKAEPGKEEAAAEKVIEQSSLSDADKDDIAERVAAKLAKQNGESGNNDGKEKEQETGNGGGAESGKGESESGKEGSEENEGESKDGPSDLESGNGESDEDKVTPKTEHWYFRTRGKKAGESE